MNSLRGAAAVIGVPEDQRRESIGWLIWIVAEPERETVTDQRGWRGGLAVWVRCMTSWCSQV